MTAGRLLAQDEVRERSSARARDWARLVVSLVVAIPIVLVCLLAEGLPAAILGSVRPALTQSYVVTDWVAGGIGTFLPKRATARFVFVDVDDESFEKWGGVSETPPDKLGQILRVLHAATPRAVHGALPRRAQSSGNRQYAGR